MIIALAALAFFVNIPLGYWREGFRKFSVGWFVAIHISVPFIFLLRISWEISPWWIPLSISMAIAGQVVGSRYRRNKGIRVMEQAPSKAPLSNPKPRLDDILSDEEVEEAFAGIQGRKDRK